jgi:hypothetical protein
MKHPFDEILPENTPSQLADQDTQHDTQQRAEVASNSDQPSRRQVLKKSLIAGTGSVMGLSLASENDKAHAGLVTTQAIGEEGGAKPKPHPRPSTRRAGEEGGRPPVATTERVGEEGGNLPGSGTTKAVGEEGGVKPGRPVPFELELASFYATLKTNDIYMANSRLHGLRQHKKAASQKAAIDNAVQTLEAAAKKVIKAADAALKKNAFEDGVYQFDLVKSLNQAPQSRKLAHQKLNALKKSNPKGYEMGSKAARERRDFESTMRNKHEPTRLTKLKSFVKKYPKSKYASKAKLEMEKIADRLNKKNNPRPPAKVTTFALGEEG